MFYGHMSPPRKIKETKNNEIYAKISGQYVPKIYTRIFDTCRIQTFLNFDNIIL